MTGNVAANGTPVRVDFEPEETVLGVLRRAGFTEVKRGCEQGECGFCTPGMVMATFWLLSRNPDPSDDEIREALAGNLCRCTGYVKIVEAVRLAAGRMREDG